MNPLSDSDLKVQQSFKRGDLVFFHNINTLPHLRTLAGSFLTVAQAWSREGDASVVHVGFIDDPNPSPKQGEAAMNYVHSMPGEGMKKEALVRNYHLSVFRLKPGAIAGFNSEQLAEKAVDYALQFQGVKYSFLHCAETLFSQATRENAELNEQYTQHLCERHLFNPTSKTILPTDQDEGLHCSEAVITCLQLAALAHSDASAAQETLPDFVKLHYHTSPVGLHNFVKNSPWFYEVEPELVHELRMSGVPHPYDYTQAIIPYSPPAPQSWGSWLWAQVPNMPSMSFAFSALNTVYGWFKKTPAPTTEVRELVNFSGRGRSRETETQLEDLSKSSSSRLE